MKKYFSIFGILTFTFLSFSNVYSGVNPFIDSLRPKQNEVSVNRASDINIYFSSDMNASTLNSNTIKIHASQTGLLNTSITYDPGTKKLTINPNNDFKAGEEISIHLSNGIRTSANLPIIPFVYNCIARTNEIQSMFARQSAVNTGGDPRFIATGDFNHDGDIDIAVSNYTAGSVLVLMNTGNGTFVQSQIINFRNANFLISFDYNCDGYLDLIATRQSYDVQSGDIAGVIYYKNNGTGMFFQEGIILFNFEVVGSDAISAIDYNGDGYFDIVSKIRSQILDPGMFIFKNVNGFGFYLTSVVTNNNINALLTTGDFDNDGDIDVAIKGYIYLNNDNGIFTSTFFNSGEVWGLINSDFNKDNYSDIAGLWYNNAQCPVFKNNGNASFSTLSVNNVNIGPVYNASGDFNGDGNLDIAVANRNSNDISILKNNGSGFFDSFTINNNFGAYLNGINTADVDTDGDLDIVVANISVGTLTIFFNDKEVHINNENGIPNKFELSQNYPNPFNPSTVISYEIPSRSYVSLKVYNVMGTEVHSLVSEVKNAGQYEIVWDAANFSNGIYFYTLESDVHTSTKKMILIK